MPRAPFSCCSFGNCSALAPVIVGMDGFWRNSIKATFGCQEHGDPACSSDLSIILGTSWEANFHIWAEESLFYFQPSQRDHTVLFSAFFLLRA